MKRFNETAGHYKISKPTLYKWIDCGCPVHRVNGIPYFDWKEIDKWIKTKDDKK